MCWHVSGTKFVTGHRDGAVLHWTLEPDNEEQGHVLSQKKYFGNVYKNLHAHTSTCIVL